MAKWNERPSWTDFKDINNGQNFSRILTPEDLNALAENIYYLYSYRGGVNSAIPIEVSTEAEMTELLKIGEIGGVYKYTGTTGIYENGALYVLEATDEPDEPDTPDTPDTPDEPEENTFTFTIVGRTSNDSKETYTVENGTTWSEWIAGNGLEWYSVESRTDYVYASVPRIAYILNSNGNIVKGSEPITEGGVYSVEAEDALEGTWVFNDTVNLSPLTSDTMFKINFTFGANDTEGTAIQILGGDDVEVDYEYYDDEEGEYAFSTAYYGPNGWYTDKTIHITTKLSELSYTVGNSLLAWLEANATKQ
jgi:hypothetical protein